jgi:cytochrome c-type biogenesis protein
MPARVCALVALLVLVPVASAARHAQGTGLRTVRYAQPPPDFSFDMGAGATRLSALTGKPVVINFWATWCRPCLEELPALERVRQTYGARVTIVTLSAEPPGVAKSYLEQKGVALPLVEDPERKIFDAYAIGPVPVTLVLDSKGAVAHVSVGQLDWPELQAALDATLGP